MHGMAKVAAIIGLVSVIGVGSAWAGRVGERQIRQGARIQQGYRSGELTRGETRLLAREQRRIQRFKAHAWSDGRLSPRERGAIRRDQNAASRHIHRFKHNGRNR